MRRGVLPYLGAVVLLAANAAGARAEAALEQLDQVKKDLQTRYDALQAAKPPDKRGNRIRDFREESSRLQSGLTELQRVHAALEAGDVQGALNFLAAVQSNNGLPQETKAAAGALLARLRTERDAQETADAAEIDAECKRAGQAMLSAKAAGDLDATIQELTRLVATFEPRNSLGQRGAAGARGSLPAQYGQRVRDALRLATIWQDYVAALSQNNMPQAESQMRTLATCSNETLDALGIPRSEILKRQPKSAAAAEAAGAAAINPAAADTIIDKIKTLDDLPPAIRDLNAMQDEMLRHPFEHGAARLNDLAATLRRLQALRQTYLELQSGLIRSPQEWMSRLDSGSGLRADGKLIELRVQLVALAMPRMLGLPEADKAAPGERMDLFLNRLIAEATKRQDWQAVARGLAFRRVLAPHSALEGTVFDDDDVEAAFRQFLAGQNFEQAGQYEQAVISYLCALSSGLQEIPVVFITARLDAIKKMHPEEYAAGSRATLPDWSHHGSHSDSRSPANASPSPAGAKPGAAAPHPRPPDAPE